MSMSLEYEPASEPLHIFGIYIESCSDLTQVLVMALSGPWRHIHARPLSSEFRTHKTVSTRFWPSRKRKVQTRPGALVALAEEPLYVPTTLSTSRPVD